MINTPIPELNNAQLAQTISEILRRAIDGTTLPLFIDRNARSINIGALSGAIDPFFCSVVAGFNKKANFYDNVSVQRNMCISGDLVVSGLLQAGTIVAKKIIVSEIVEQ